MKNLKFLLPLTLTVIISAITEHQQQKENKFVFKVMPFVGKWQSTKQQTSGLSKNSYEQHRQELNAINFGRTYTLANAERFNNVEKSVKKRLNLVENSEKFSSK